MTASLKIIPVFCILFCSFMVNDKADAITEAPTEDVFYYFDEFKAGEFLEISSGTNDARVEDLIVEPSEDTFLGLMKAHARVGIKNLTTRKLHISVYLALFDHKLQLVASGNYSSTKYGGGFKPREAGTQTINLGYLVDLSGVRYYQYRVVTLLEEPKS